MEEILIIGAGAIGRGYLPWVLSEVYHLIFVDSNLRLIDRLRSAGSYSTYRVKNGELESRRIRVHAAYSPDEFRLDQHKNIKAVFISVGPRNCPQASRLTRGLDCPIILCENDPETVARVKEQTENDRVFFAVPDVITSNSAPDAILRKDPLSVVTEDGQMFIDSGAGTLKGELNFCSAVELQKQWVAKLYLHNTPHCIAAYLGAYHNLTYIHEAMHTPKIEKVVQGVMEEMLEALKKCTPLPHNFLNWYAKKELERFRCRFLCDPISRVAREPLRKLEPEGRIIGAAQLCLSVGILPQNILLGLVSALLFEDGNDPDHHIVFLRRALEPDVFLTHILKLRRGEALERILSRELDSLIETLQGLMKDKEKKRAA